MDRDAGADQPTAGPSADNLSWTIGAVSVERVEENLTSLPTKVLIPDVTPEHVAAQAHWIGPYMAEPVDGQPVLALSLHSFVVRSGGTTIVVDTCVGPDPDRGLQGDPAFLDRLEASIVGGAAAVDVVVCTHLHFDHVGWNTVDVDGELVPTFPNARYLVTRAEMDELARDDHMAVDEPSIRPLAKAGVLDVIDLDADGNHHITDEVRLVDTPGHTAGHVSVLIESGGQVGFITGDAFHSPLQMSYPELAAWRFDSDSAQSVETRRHLVDRFLDTEVLILGTHFAPPTGGLLRRGSERPWFDGGT
jgi:glyoxylase-like metal-dependent hydrolase (beta-lactamase superfamily II)